MSARNSVTVVGLALLGLLGSGCSGDTGDSDGADGASGSGAGGGAGAGGATVNCPADGGPIEPTALIDDFEDGDGSLPRVADRNGTWWITGDATPTAIIEPPLGAPAPPPAERVLGGRCDSNYAMRVTGEGFMDWGSGFGLNFRYDASGSTGVDISGFRGIRFWARVGELNTAIVNVGFGDAYSSPDGGECDPNGGPMSCYDHFGTQITPLGQEWREYVVYFDTLRQRGYGLPREALDTTALYSLSFGFSVNSVFDLWVDDLWLVR